MMDTVMNAVGAVKDSAARVIGNRALLKCDSGCGENATAIVIELSSFSGEIIGQRFRCGDCSYGYWKCQRCSYHAKSGEARVLFIGGREGDFCHKCAKPGEVRP